jgi:CheY-like chemotaxis protein
MNGQKLVLLAEDSRDDAFFLRRAFLSAGITCSVVDVRNGQQAINYLSGNNLFEDRCAFPMPNLVIVDLKMPLVDGFEVLAWVQAQPALKSLPVIVLSSSNLQIDKEKAQALGALEYLVKPNNPAELVQVVEQLKQKWLTPAHR